MTERKYQIIGFTRVNETPILVHEYSNIEAAQQCLDWLYDKNSDYAIYMKDHFHCDDFEIHSCFYEVPDFCFCPTDILHENGYLD